MASPSTSALNIKRALWTFLVSYAAVTVVATAFSFLIIAITHAPTVPESQAVHSHAYVLSERYQPLINLVSWTLFAALYFKPRSNQQRTYREAFKLGALWLPIALVIDLVFFVLIKNRISLSPHDFYIGQMPWIYLIYVTVFTSPALYVLLQKASRK
ncbi:MAG TPA: hypothetical protein VLG16_02305 [Candidatus Saccharimonadales bacterium]|nr:hypothetical protein [Candidatus Saccharimonadales bacterium]